MRVVVSGDRRIRFALLTGPETPCLSWVRRASNSEAFCRHHYVSSRLSKGGVCWSVGVHPIKVQLRPSLPVVNIEQALRRAPYCYIPRHSPVCCWHAKQPAAAKPPPAVPAAVHPLPCSQACQPSSQGCSSTAEAGSMQSLRVKQAERRCQIR